MTGKRRKIRYVWYGWILMQWILLFPGTVSASEQGVGIYLDRLDLEGIEQCMEDLLPEKGMTFKEMVLQLAGGKIPFSSEMIKELALETVRTEVENQKNIMIKILVLSITAAFFSVCLKAFDQGQTQSIAFYMVYMLLFTLLLNGYMELNTMVKVTMGRILQFMRLLIPVYLAAAALASETVTAIGFYELTLISLALVQKIILMIVLPGIGGYLLVAMMNHISKEDNLKKMLEFLKMLISWALKTVAAFVVGIQTIQRMLLPAIDALKNSLLLKVGDSIPVVGNIVSNVTETVLGTAVLLKSAIGVGGVLVVLLFCMIPVLKLVLCLFVYRGISAVVQPISDKRFADCISSMADAVGLLFMALLVTCMLFLLTIVVVTVSGR